MSSRRISDVSSWTGIDPNEKIIISGLHFIHGKRVIGVKHWLISLDIFQCGFELNRLCKSHARSFVSTNLRRNDWQAGLQRCYHLPFRFPQKSRWPLYFRSEGIIVCAYIECRGFTRSDLECGFTAIHPSITTRICLNGNLARQIMMSRRYLQNGELSLRIGYQLGHGKIVGIGFRRINIQNNVETAASNRLSG